MINHESTVPIPESVQAGLFSRAFEWGRQHHAWLLAGAAILLLAYRLGLMLALPLADTTEARYGEIARLTASSGFWLMHHIDPQTPFFAKPPLSTWLSAASMRLLGVNEFAARLPSLLASLAAIWVGLGFARELQVRRRWLVIPVLASCPLFFISAGAVMTDATQLVVIAAALYFAWRVLDAADRGLPCRRFRLAFWAMIGICALSKGMASWALVGLPLTAYALLERKPLRMLKQLFDWAGVAIALCIFVPWYAAAEYYYPGFLNYFIVGEHFSRFLVSGWNGDRYGTAHWQPLGAIWVFWVAAILPWTVVFLTELARILFRKQRPSSPLERFLWCATLTPLVFFTFSRNIIWTYGLTSVLPFAVLAAKWLDDATPSVRFLTGVGIAAVAVVSVLCAPLVLSNVSGNSDRDLVKAFAREAEPGTNLIYRTRPTFSSSFYTQGTFRYKPDAAPIDRVKQYVVIDRQDVESRTIDPRQIIFKGTRRALVEQ